MSAMIQFQNVSKCYPDDIIAVQDINLTIEQGEYVFLSGPSGAGKSTLVKLLCGFFDPTEGRVLLNGEDIRKYNRKEYYGLFSAVFQDFSILAGTIAENVAQSVEEIDDSRVKEAIKDAGLKENVERLPEQYETRLGRSVHLDAYELSGGETQRLMLARALYRNAPVIVLDEPTAALDPFAEYEIYTQFHNMIHGRTAVMITHRLSAVQLADKVAVFDDGHVAEYGTHAELYAKGGIYTEMFDMQAKFYRDLPSEPAAESDGEAGK